MHVVAVLSIHDRAASSEADELVRDMAEWLDDAHSR